MPRMTRHGRSLTARAPGVAGTATATIIAVTSAMAACGPPIAEPEPDATDVTVFEGAHLIVGDGRTIDDATFIVDGDQLVAVGPTGDIELPSGASFVDLTGRTVMPAIIDTHVHLATTRDDLIDDLRRKAFYGVGVVMSLGRDADELAYQIRAEPVAGAARFRTAGRGITRPEPGRTDIPYWVETESEARSAVRDLAELGVDIVKVWVDDRDGQYEKMTPELYGAVIDEAHQLGLRVTAHIYALEDAKGLLRAGIDAFAHGVRDRDVDDEFVSLIKEHPDVVLVPNLSGRGVADDLRWLGETIPADELAQMQAASSDRPDAQAAFAIQARNLDRLNREGVVIAFGTDGSAGWSPHVEMADMVEAGMTPAEVIVAATRNSADLVGLTDAGTLEAGKSADFVVLDANPLEAITNTRQIESVYLRGQAVDRAGLSQQWLGRPAE